MNGVLTLPKKITPGTTPTAAAIPKPKPVPGPGATITMSIDDPSKHPAECGGSNPPCLGKVLSITNPDNSCGTPPCPILPGYTDPKKPALVTVDWFGGTFPADSTLYIVKDGSTVAIPIAPCVKSHGAYTNTPCVKKHKLKKKTGQITDVIALLFGDPIIRR